MLLMGFLQNGDSRILEGSVGSDDTCVVLERTALGEVQFLPKISVTTPPASSITMTPAA
eukprot:m.69523 g.69523  ORF g.69523 m.69523 type:complete len:59 (-) comp13739_c0_seq1:1067-1243(-)